VKSLHSNVSFSSFSISKYVIEVLEVFHINPSNSKLPVYFLLSISTLCALCSEIFNNDVCNQSQISIQYTLSYSDTCRYQIAISLYQSCLLIHAIHSVEGHIIFAILMQLRLVVPRVNMNQKRYRRRGEVARTLFTGDIIQVSSTLCQFALMTVMMKWCFQFFSGTKKWACL